MKFDRFRRDVCDIMIIVLLLVSFADSVMYAISDNLTTNGSRTAIFMLTVLFLIAERQHSDNKYREYRKERRK